MKNIIYAKSAATNIYKELDHHNKVHSIFQNGLNINSKNGLVFIGTDKNGELPFGIHLWKKDIEKLIDMNKEGMCIFNKDDNILVFPNMIVDLNRAYYYKSILPPNKRNIGEKELIYLLGNIRDLNFYTGLDFRVEDILSENNELMVQLRNSMASKDKDFIQSILRKIIGRGKGLTPSGDDLLIGLIWLNDIRRIFTIEFLNALRDLVLNEELTTCVSLSYYKSALLGQYSSKLIDLCHSLIDSKKEMINSSILEIMEYGHTSGSDLLSGIALGVYMMIKMKEE